jgi:hypothetical protein
MWSFFFFSRTPPPSAPMQPMRRGSQSAQAGACGGTSSLRLVSSNFVCQRSSEAVGRRSSDGERCGLCVVLTAVATRAVWRRKINEICAFYTVNSFRAAPAAGRLHGPSVVGAYRRGAWGPLGPPGGPRLAADAPCGRAGGSARLLVSGAAPPPPGAETRFRHKCAQTLLFCRNFCS